MSKEALALWQTLPADTRRMLLSNVWCVECRKAVTIVDYHAELKGVVVLEGFCDTCGHKVARVIDDLASTPKKKAKAAAAVSGLYKEEGEIIKEAFCCPHIKEEKCICRKPSPYFIEKVRKAYNIDEKIINSLKRRLSAEDKKQLIRDIRYAPAWIGEIFKQLNS